MPIEEVFFLLKIFLLILVIIVAINIINYFRFPETIIFSAEDLSLVNFCLIVVGIFIIHWFVRQISPKMI